VFLFCFVFISSKIQKNKIDKDGKISTKELQTVLKEFGLKPSQVFPKKKTKKYFFHFFKQKKNSGRIRRFST
jgi:uncharacterized protein YneF (UPF0154 family)